MPKLSKAKAKSVAQATNDFEAMPEGRYTVKLVGIESKTGIKAPYWATTLEVLVSLVPGETEDYAGRKLWENLSMADASEWRMKQFFDAFGVPMDTDTDDMIGKYCDVFVLTETQQQGKGAGKERNTIDSFMPTGGDPEEPF